MIEENKGLYKIREELFGERWQLRKAQEELGECIAAINHYLNDRPGGRKALIDEVADCILMVEQMTYMLGEKEVLQRMQEKILIVRQKIAEKEGQND